MLCDAGTSAIVSHGIDLGLLEKHLFGEEVAAS
jgi:hypothetical protein